MFSKVEGFLKKSKENFQTYLSEVYNLSLPLPDENIMIISCLELLNQNTTENNSIILNIKFVNFTMSLLNINSSDLNFNSILLESILINRNAVQKKLKVKTKRSY
jgi:uncharacterized membrane protein